MRIRRTRSDRNTQSGPVPATDGAQRGRSGPPAVREESSPSAAEIQQNLNDWLREVRERWNDRVQKSWNPQGQGSYARPSLPSPVASFGGFRPRGRGGARGKTGTNVGAKGDCSYGLHQLLKARDVQQQKKEGPADPGLPVLHWRPLRKMRPEAADFIPYVLSQMYSQTPLLAEAWWQHQLAADFASFFEQSADEPPAEGGERHPPEPEAKASSEKEQDMAPEKAKQAAKKDTEQLEAAPEATEVHPISTEETTESAQPSSSTEPFLLTPLITQAQEAADLTPTSALHAVSAAAPSAASEVYTLPPLITQAMIDSQIRAQIEYYFSAPNLGHDIYLRSLMDSQGWVGLDEIVNFPRLRHYGLDAKSAAAVMFCSYVVEVSWGTPPKIRLRSSDLRDAFPHVDLPSSWMRGRTRRQNKGKGSKAKGRVQRRAEEAQAQTGT
mmetsp:Transcript_75934/g.210827  ORF Transcript_75934/g.210827 Transcript_75934/m.210827 type:complete len:440 (-) Transcript_75934:298-1617(-)|eukprot:CAMPEP_0117497386 /NCGR_PEP_ID=MMETSP0784-20121206/21156_1 /TAXON_ID=39447 /ORGANISM="" /LENGTH=439 /DNA_ID=CAMNT_0005292407 /DNA_START=118 /DNA_END=1437 /DNA_ORIENTATION=+